MPDIIISDMKKVIFIHGCFWHGQGCKRRQLPKTNRPFGENKISGNQERDSRNYDKLKVSGWIIW
jgi:DNA mismatch endonuclease (patch repair protein)